MSADSGQEHFNRDNGIVNLGDWLASRLSPAELELFCELCASGSAQWEQAAVDGIVEHAKETLHKLSIVIEIRDKRSKADRQGKLVSTHVIIKYGLQSLNMPDGFKVKKIRKMRKHSRLPIQTIEVIESYIASFASIAV